MVEEPQAKQILGARLTRDYTLEELLRRPDIHYRSLMALPQAGPGVEDDKVAEQIEIQAKYSGYIARQEDEIQRSQRYEATRLPEDLDYAQVRGLSTEVSQKLAQTRPATLGQASRISGVTPAAVSLLLVYLKKRRLLEKRIA